MEEEKLIEENSDEAMEAFSQLIDEQLQYMESRVNYLNCVEKVFSHERKQLELYKNENACFKMKKTIQKLASAN